VRCLSFFRFPTAIELAIDLAISIASPDLDKKSLVVPWKHPWCLLLIEIPIQAKTSRPQPFSEARSFDTGQHTRFLMNDGAFVSERFQEALKS
jgi:hypothetical protein